MTEQPAPYHIETITQRLARLGVELAELMQRMYKTAMTPQEVNHLAERVEVVAGEIMALSESWDKSNE